MIARYNLLQKSYWFALISARGMTLDKLLLPRSSSFFAMQVIWGGRGFSGFSYCTFLILESSQLSEFLTDLQDF